MADKPEMTLERIAERINEVGNRIFTQNVFRARELHECANELRALSPPRITRGQVLAAVNRYNNAMWGEGPKDHTEATNTLLHELGIAVDPPAEAEK